MHLDILLVLCFIFFTYSCDISVTAPETVTVFPGQQIDTLPKVYKCSFFPDCMYT